QSLYCREDNRAATWVARSRLRRGESHGKGETVNTEASTNKNAPAREGRAPATDRCGCLRGIRRKGIRRHAARRRCRARRGGEGSDLSLLQDQGRAVQSGCS